MTTTPQELKPSDYQDALDAWTSMMPYITDEKQSISAIVKSALSRCAAEPVDAGEFHTCEHIMNRTASRIYVPGGWIYTVYRLDCGQMNSVFVPISNPTTQAKGEA